MIIEMTKIYPQTVIEKADEIIQILTEEGFFEFNEIDNLDFTSKHIKDKLTEKFILGTLDDEEEMFTEEEFETLLKEIIAGTVLEELKSKGLVGSYEDEDTEEMFFLTPKGKKYLKNID
jgi:DNA-binding PadR family transcriptional regulator